MHDGNWQDALEAQMELFKFWRSPLGIKYGLYFVDDKTVESPKRHGFDPDPSIASQMLGHAPDLASVEASKMLFADPVYVTNEMFEIAEAASETFEPEPLQETDLLTHRGFVLLPRPFVVPDINNLATTWRAFAWMPAQSPDGKHLGIHLSTYTNYADQREDGYILDPGLKWQPLHIAPWWFGQECPADFKNVPTWWNKCQALMRLMMQQIAVREERQAPRGTRRRWQRDLPDKPEPYIVVVRLRRPKSHPSGDHHTVDWKQQWIVGGHWRNQWYPSLGIHRQIWISDYVKGPEDKPLVVRKGRAFELVR
jgi:hypothetical protein